MRKFYSILFSLLTLCGVAQAQVKVVPSAAEGESEGISFTTAKNAGTTAPTYNANYGDLRIYAKGTITITSTVDNMTSIVFNISAQGKKRLAPITADKGTIATQASGDATVTWTGDASTVTFTVGDKADYGTESSKAGQLCFTDFTVMVGQADPDYVANPVIKPATGTYYAAQEVTITAGEGTTVYYTTDGSEPTTSSSVYTAPFTVSETTTVKAIAVKGENKSEVAESVITIETLETKTIAEVIAAGAVDATSTQGTVVALSKNGLLLGDGTGYIYTYTGAAPEVQVGDVVSVAGKVSAYGGCMQFSGVTIEKKGTAAVSYPTATIADGAAIDALVAAPAVTYIQVEGKLTSTGNYVNFSIEGATAVGSILATADVLGTVAVGNSVKVTGFFIYQSSSNKYANIIATKVEVTDDSPVELPEYTTIAAMKAAATATKTEVVYKPTDVLVTYVNGSSVYVYDGTDGFLLYGTNTGIKAGDKISATITGNLYLYNGLTEIAVSKYENVTVASENNEVTVQTVQISDLTVNPKAYENELVMIEDLTPTAEAVASKVLVLTDESENEITLRDNWNCLSTFAFDTQATYNLTGFVAIYEKKDGENVTTTIQIYPRSADDVENTAQAGLIEPEAAWSAESVTVTVGESVTAAFSTNSDGVVTYESSNTSVATVDEQGQITVVGAGVASITAKLEASSIYKSAIAVLVVNVTTGAAGTLESPYTIGDVQALLGSESVTEKVWVKAYIIGSANGGFKEDKLVKEGGETAVASNLVLADNAEETDINKMIPIQLTDKSAARAALNLKDNAANLGIAVWVYGSLDKYFSVAGLKNVTDWSFDGVETAVERIAAPIATAKEIYNIAGQRVQKAEKAGLYIIDGKKVVVK